MNAQRGDEATLFDQPFTDGLSSLIAAADTLKSPISLIRQLSLSLEDEGLSIEERNKIVRQIRLTSERSLDVTDDLTKSIQLNDAMVKLEPINPRQVCENVVSDLSQIFEAKNRKLKIISPRQPALVVGDRDLLKRVLISFSNNALRYTELNKSVEIRIFSKNENTVRLGVRDYGPKISKAMLSRFVYGDMKSVPISYARPFNKGLSIYVASQFAEAMKGKVGAVKHRDGVTFYIELQASSQLRLI